MSSTRSKRFSVEYSFQPQAKKISSDESEEYKNTIYEKTMKKLRDGAKMNGTPKSVVDAVTPTKSSISQSEVKRGLKQISLNSSGRLENENKIINPKEYCPTLPEKCCFCERLGCFTLLKQCGKCEEYFCDNCSFSTFIAFGESHICKSCFR